MTNQAIRPDAPIGSHYSRQPNDPRNQAERGYTPVGDAAEHGRITTEDTFASSKPTTLGAHVTQPSKELETFDNPAPDNEYEVNISTPEFTANCPKTGQPDFATIALRYAPDKLCVELKSFKLYLWSFRNEGHFHEDVTNRILNDLVAALHPRWIEVTGDFNVRGGVKTVVRATWSQAQPSVKPTE